MKALKAVQFDGQPLKVDRYRPLQQEGDSAYDIVTGTVQSGHVCSTMLWSLISTPLYNF